MEQFRRFETPAMEFMNGPTVPSERQSRQDCKITTLLSTDAMLSCFQRPPRPLLVDMTQLTTEHMIL